MGIKLKQNWLNSGQGKLATAPFQGLLNKLVSQKKDLGLSEDETRTATFQSGIINFAN
jgi:hypothetical protein